MNRTSIMTDNSSTASSHRSGFQKLKLRFEKGTPSLSKNINDSPKPQQQFFTKPSIMNLHRRQRSVDKVIYDTQELNLGRSGSKSPSPKKNSFLLKHKYSSSTNSSDINLTPEIKQVSNFSSPTKSILSLYSSTAPNSPVSKHDGSQRAVPQINITEPDDYSQEQGPIFSKQQLSPKESNSKLDRFKKKTLSMFFDQGSRTSSSSTFAPDSEPRPQRPKLSKSHSDNDRTPTKSTEDSEIDGVNYQVPTISSQQDLNRKRSKTLGSVENDLYHKRNGSIVKTLGSMMLLKPKNSNTDSSNASVSQVSLDSDTHPTSRVHTPPDASEGETPEEYVERLLEEGFEFEATSILSLSDEIFLNECLRYFICEKFHFHNVPLDLALRKFLMFCELPKEAQQIDRVLNCFSVRYYQCNIKLWDNPDQIYFLTFSLVMLHTDYYNPNNKKKMTKEEFVKNTRVDNGDSSVSNPFLTKEILEYFYDNIIYTKFLKHYQAENPTLQSQTVYSLPKRIFSSASSTNLEGISRQPSSSNLRSQSFSAATSQIFSSAPMVDPYNIIITDRLDTLKLDMDLIHFRNPFEGSFHDFFQKDSLSLVRQQMSGNRGLFIRYNKDCSWLTSKTEIQITNPDEIINDEKRILLKVIKVDEIFREETVVNNKFFTLGTTSRVIWKKYYALLTTCGLFMFDTLSFLSIFERRKIFDKDFGDEPFIVEVLLDFILRSCLKYSLNGLFACVAASGETAVENSFNIFSTNRKENFRTATHEEMSSWISSINYIAALDSCYIESRPEINHEVVPLRNTTIEEKISKLEKNKITSLIKLNYNLTIAQHIQTLTPFSARTRESLNNHLEALGIKIDWLWYEIERNMVYTDILRHETTIDDRASIRTNGEESFLEESFINDDYYKHFEKQDISKGSPLGLIDTPASSHSKENGEDDYEEKEENKNYAVKEQQEDEEEQEEKYDDEREEIFVDALD